ncbi:phage terminase small subunit P27 family [Streptomyces maoxianensis]|uniref:Phage terminase small subunit P27 family n=1 Tax=Streptomyces maoxianensis TaxID=1459942 RepID=A0ABV9G420_9ACTN
MPQPRKTNRLRILSGQAPRPELIIGGPLGIPDAPDWLPEKARAEWDRVTAVCGTHPLWLQHGDVAILTAYCHTWATWLEAAQDIADRGSLVPGRSSADSAGDDGPRLVKNPSVQIARDAAAQLRALCRELGFSPDARRRVDIGVLEDQDPDADLLNPERLLT